MNGVFQIEMRRQRREVVGIMVHVVAVADLGGSPMAAPVMGDDAIAVIEEEHHLRVPVVGRKRPAMTEHNGLTLAPVLVKNFDAVLRFDKAHATHSLSMLFGSRAGRASSNALISQSGEKAGVDRATAPFGIMLRRRRGLCSKSVSGCMCRFHLRHSTTIIPADLA